MKKIINKIKSIFKENLYCACCHKYKAYKYIWQDANAYKYENNPNENCCLFFKSKEDYINYIKTKAYFLWENAGKPENKDIDFWLQAKKEVHKNPIAYLN